MPKNKYIHGTTSRIFATLAKTDFQFMSPMQMLEKYKLAPMSGEITKGGLSTPSSTCNMCFGKLGISTNYDQERIIKNYSNLKAQIPTLAELDTAINQCIKYELGNINEIIILLARAKQWGIDIDKLAKSKAAALATEFKTTKQFYYAILCIANYAQLNALSREEKRAIRIYFTTDKVRALVANLDIDLENVWNNPTEDHFNILSNLFALPEGKIMLRNILSDHDEQEISLSSKVPIYSFTHNKPTILIPEQYKRKAEEAAGAFRALAKKYDNHEIGNYLQRDAWDLLNRDVSLLQAMQHYISTHVIALQQSYKLLNEIINTPIKNMQFSADDKQFIIADFPLLLLLEDENLIVEAIGDEYRASDGLTLGKDIKIIATDNDEHKSIVKAWLLKHGLSNVQVVLFADIKPKMHAYIYNLNGNELIDKLSADSVHHAVSKYSLKQLYAMPTGTGEGYSIKEHTEMVLSEFQKHASMFEFYDLEMPTQISDVRCLMKAMICLHDIGKSISAKHKQHENTSPILKAYLNEWGFNEEEIKLAVNLVGHNLLGDLVVRSFRCTVTDDEVTNCVASLEEKASACGLGLLPFFKLQCLYYLSDAGSYKHVKDNFMLNVTEDIEDKHKILSGYKYIPKDSSCFLRIVEKVEAAIKLKQTKEVPSMLTQFLQLLAKKDTVLSAPDLNSEPTGMKAKL